MIVGFLIGWTLGALTAALVMLIITYFVVWRNK